ncbi:MAG: hypothetical protein HY927_03940 [Elusimicrobia bacterium]|nr:hypothetical protein [Elusimicrobiota bacterium]
MFKRLADVCFHVRTLPLRARFLTGRASFVEATVLASQAELSYVVDQSGKSLGPRMLQRRRLGTGSPRTGTQGWTLFLDAFRDSVPEAMVDLECGYCGHMYVVRILLPAPRPANALPESARDARPLGRPAQAAPGVSGSGAPPPASFASEWFSFVDKDCAGAPSLSCGHCEQKSEPGVKWMRSS